MAHEIPTVQAVEYLENALDRLFDENPFPRNLSAEDWMSLLESEIRELRAAESVDDRIDEMADVLADAGFLLRRLAATLHVDIARIQRRAADKQLARWQEIVDMNGGVPPRTTDEVKALWAKMKGSRGS